MKALLFAGIFLTAPSLALNQSETPSTAPTQEQSLPDGPYSEPLADLFSEDPDKQEAARLALVTAGREALPHLEGVFRELAQEPNPETMAKLLKIMGVLQAMGPEAVHSIEFMADSTSKLNKEKLESWREDGTGEAVEAYNALWDAMRLAIGATGRPGFEMLMAGADKGKRTQSGVPYGSILGTILPNGKDSMEAIAEFAFSEEKKLRDTGMRLCWYAADDLGPFLLERFKQGSQEDRLRCVGLMQLNLPYSKIGLSSLFVHEDPQVRTLALAAACDSANPYLLDPKTGEYRSYRNWHGHLYPTPEKPFEALRALRNPIVTVALSRALSHGDEETRSLAAFLTCQIADRDTALPENIELARKDESKPVAFWAEEAWKRSQEIDTRWLEALSQVEAGLDWADIEDFSALKASALEAIQKDPAAYAQIEREPVPQAAIVRMEALLEFLQDSEWNQEDLLPHLEAIRHQGMWAIVEDLDNCAFNTGLAHDALRRFGKAAYPEFEADYLKEPRFSVGHASWSERHEYFKQMGPATLPLAAQTFFHWREEVPEEFSQSALKDLGEHSPPADAIAKHALAWRKVLADQYK